MAFFKIYHFSSYAIDEQSDFFSIFKLFNIKKIPIVYKKKILFLLYTQFTKRFTNLIENILIRINYDSATYQSRRICTEANLRKKINSTRIDSSSRTFVERFDVRSRVKMAPEKGRGRSEWIYLSANNFATTNARTLRMQG